MLIDLAKMAKIHKFGLANSLLDSPIGYMASLTVTGTLIQCSDYVSGDRTNYHNCRIHQVTASMTTIDLIINLGQDVLESVTALFKLAVPSLSNCALSIISVSFTFVIV